MFKAIPVVVIVTLAGAGSVAMAGEGKSSAPQEPVGFVTGGIVGGFAAGPFGAVIGAGLGTWLGNRVHRAGEARAAEKQAADLMGDKNELIRNNQALTAQLDKMSQEITQSRVAPAEPASLLKGLQGDVLFRTASYELTPDMALAVQTLARALGDSPSIKIRLDGYADPRGNAEDNLKLSEARADAVRDLLLASGVNETALEVNAYGKDKSCAAEGDLDGYALERRVRITVVGPEAASAVAQVESR